MSTAHRFRTALKWTAGAVGFAAGTYAGYIGVTWLRYGHPEQPDTDDADAFLERFMPTYESPNVATSLSLRQPISHSSSSVKRT
jgi:hypothetical protein